MGWILLVDSSPSYRAAESMVHALKYYCGEGVLPAVQEADCPGISKINEIVFMLLLSDLMDVIKITIHYISVMVNYLSRLRLRRLWLKTWTPHVCSQFRALEDEV